MNLRILELLAAVGTAFLSAAYVWTRQHYDQIANETAKSNPALPRYLASHDDDGNNNNNNNQPSFLEKLQCVLLHVTTKWTRHLHKTPYALVAEPHKYIPGLKPTRAARKNEVSNIVNKDKSNKASPPPPLVIGTIRMGFGHHRISYAVASYVLQEENDDNRREVYFHDIATIGDDESGLVDDAETAYSLGSRALTELPNGLERMVAKLSSNGGPNALRMQVQTARLIKSLMEGLDRSSPIIATHPLVGAMAVAANFSTVVNLVVDNHPQWFVVVPGALNLVQGPRLYRELLKMGVPDADLELAGHWNPRNIVQSIPQATERRIHRIQHQQPLRLLIPLGGAGAQQSFLTELLHECIPLVKEGKLQLWLNAGDHEHMKTAFQDELERSKMDYQFISSVPARNDFVANLTQDAAAEPSHPITLFAYNTSYAAVTTTDELVPYADVLVCKPSEMAFYAVPKLMIRRVGDHEAKSAVRAAEVGDGTLEAATVAQVVTEIHQFWNKPSDLITMNRMIRHNHEIGMYDGAKIAVQRALAMAEQNEVNGGDSAKTAL
mmetsp:Transcript_14584/g.29570  ORF Transcript_14584/g.29570 Transcript_14584/m.29570 type:complete len:551 (+) Transcript_14584:197-1849(+)